MQVREIIQSNLREQGIEGQARPYIDSLASTIETRLNAVVDNLTEFALSKGLSAEEAERAFVEAGLVQPVVIEAPEPVTPDATDLMSTLNRINSTLDSLASFARRHGYTG